MRVRWTALVPFVIGVLVGGLGATMLVGRHYNRLFRDWYLMGVVEQAQIAQQIRAGAGEQLAERIETSLPGYALAVDAQFGRSGPALPALWSVRGFYRASETPVPDEIAELLGSLPPSPAGCCAVDRPEPE